MKSKNFLRVFLTLTLCLIGGIASWADNITYTSEGIIYSVDRDNLTASVAGFESGIAVANVRSRVGKNTVVSIGNSAFSGCSSLTSVSIPSSVTSIGESAFSSCSSLTSVSIPSSVTIIEKRAFEKCSSLASITIPSSVTSIGESAFEKCSSLASITIPSSVTSIGEWAFYQCSSLASITIPSSVTSIRERAFDKCYSLSSISVSSDNKNYFSDGKVLFSKDQTRLIFAVKCLENYDIPSSVTSIRLSAFDDCSSLSSISVSSDNKNYSSDGKILFSKDQTRLIFAVKCLENYDIPSSVTSIGYSAFSGCSSLASITIPSSVTSIEPSAFSGCSSLASITIPSSVTSIGYGAFSDCSSLVSLTIPSSVTSIGYNEFSGCSSLVSITIPSSVTSIESRAFYGCSSLTSITIPSSVTSIGQYAFYGCSSLASVSLSSSMTSIEENTFFGCSSLASITIPSSVTNIEHGAFFGCSSLTYVNILSKEIKFDDFCFTGTEKDMTIILKSSKVSFSEPFGFKATFICMPYDNELELGSVPNDNGPYNWYFSKNDMIFGTMLPWDYPDLYPNVYRNYYDDTFVDIYNEREEALSFIADKKDIYRVIDAALRTKLDNILNRTSDYASLVKKAGDELATLKADLHVAYNDVRKAINDLINLNNKLSEIYKQATTITSDKRIAENKAFGFPYADFNAAFSQAKKELDGACATQNTIDHLQDVVDVINSATKVDFAKSEYLTLYSYKALIVPEGMKAAVVVAKGDDISNDYRYESGETIPARTGVLFKGEKDFLGYLLESTSTEASPADNLLHGTLSDETTNVAGDNKYYKLAYDNATHTQLGFYWGAEDGAPFLNKAGKAYLAVPVATSLSQSMQGFSLNDLDNGVTTGLTVPTTTSGESLRIYDLNGRRINAQSIDGLQSGIYVVNGKKMYVK